MAKVLLTGATGAVGSEVLAELLARGHTVFCVVRPKAGESVGDRLRRLCLHPNALALSGDLLEPECGVCPALLTGVDKIIHAAADVRFDAQHARAVHDTNVGGTQQVLALADLLKVPEVHYVGTAYVAGDAAQLAEQDVGDPLQLGRPRNAYEQSKADAETLVRAWGRSRGRVSVYRPTIVVGRASDGFVRSFDGYYGFLKGLWRIAEAVRRGAATAGTPIQMTSDGLVYLPIRIRAAGSTKLNLIPSDWLAQTMAELMELPARGRTYNLAHPEPSTVRDVFLRSLPAIGICGADMAEAMPEPAPGLARLQKLATAALKRYLPYITHSPEFACEHAQEDLGLGYSAPPPMTQAFLQKTLTYAVSAWRSPGARRSADQVGRLQGVA